jgi:Flp pilus assembly protein TadD
MRYTACFILLLSLAPCALGRAQSDTAAFRAAAGEREAAGRITALVRFLETYPGSSFRGSAWSALFGLYVDQGNEARALDAASHYLAPLPAEARMGPYNSFAYSLAEKNIGLDTALAYATRAEAMARGEGPRTLSPILDTRAFVLYRKGDAAGAESLQNEAMVGNENEPEYVGHLALYQQLNGKRRLALGTMARAIFLGGGNEMQSRFMEWLSHEGNDRTSREALKDSIVMGTVHGALDTIAGERVPEAKSNAAAFMARMSVNLPLAGEYARAAEQSLVQSSPVEEYILFRQNLAMVNAADGKYSDALALLRSVEDLVDPWSTDFWRSLGSTYRRLGEPEKAVHAYMNGLIAVNVQDLRDTLESLYRSLHGSTTSLDADLGRVKESGASFDPGRYSQGAPGTGKVTLIELFTGAECGPCVASDIAVDALGEYYPGTDLSILEYHVHIPGPDPMTTNDSWSRYQMYLGRGTPTAVFDGKESIVGGGPKFVARNRFNLYRYAIQKYRNDEPGMTLKIDVARRGDTVAVAAHTGKGKGNRSAGNCLLHVALVQRSVAYTGANGISRHSMVVRKLFGGPGGTPVSSAGPGGTISVALSIRDVEAGIGEILRDPKSQPSWGGRKRNFTGWKSLPENIDTRNLKVVAWIQDAETHDVLQSVTGDVPRGTGAD